MTVRKRHLKKRNGRETIAVQLEVNESPTRPTKRATVTIPYITETNSSIRLKEKNRKIVESLDRKHKVFSMFD